MKTVWICKSYISETHPDEFSIAKVVDSKEKADAWRDQHPGQWFAVEEMEIE